MESQTHILARTHAVLLEHLVDRFGPIIQVPEGEAPGAVSHGWLTWLESNLSAEYLQPMV